MDGKGHVGEGLNAAGVRDYVANDVNADEFPLAVINIVTQVHFFCAVRYIDLGKTRRDWIRTIDEITGQ